MRVFVSDCEGPISKNDNAFEIASSFVPDGERLFTVVSRYDDVLAEVLRKPGYKAGDTLKLVLPFLKAYGVTDQVMRDFAADNLICIPGIRDTLRHIGGLAPAFIVSASYEHYLRALCRVLDFPFENTYCTRLSLDKYRLPENEKGKLKRIAEEIARMPVFDVKPGTNSLHDLSGEGAKTVRRLDEVFWKTIVRMKIGKVYSEVDPVGGDGKAEAVKSIVRKLNVSLADVMYVGDSITDLEAFRLVKGNDGLTVSFNGNQYAVENAEVAILSEHSIVTAVVADVFLRFGKSDALELVEDWSRRALERSSVGRGLLSRIFKVFPSRLPKVKMITDQNMEALGRESSSFRIRVRGEAIGRLG